MSCFDFFFQAEDGIRDLVRSRGLGDVYKRQPYTRASWKEALKPLPILTSYGHRISGLFLLSWEGCLLYTSDAADDLLCVDLGGRCIIKKKTHTINLSILHTL